MGTDSRYNSLGELVLCMKGVKLLFFLSLELYLFTACACIIVTVVLTQALQIWRFLVSDEIRRFKWDLSPQEEHTRFLSLSLSHLFYISQFYDINKPNAGGRRSDEQWGYGFLQKWIMVKQQESPSLKPSVSFWYFIKMLEIGVVLTAQCDSKLSKDACINYLESLTCWNWHFLLQKYPHPPPRNASGILISLGQNERARWRQRLYTSATANPFN